MNMKKRRVIVEGLQPQLETEPSNDYVNDETNEAVKTVYPIELYVAFIVNFSKYTKEQAKNIISSVVPSENLAHDIMRLCIFLKQTEESQATLKELVTGHSLFKMDEHSNFLVRVV